MRYPLIALIVVCFAGAAGAVEVAPQAVTPVVLSEAKTEVYRTYSLNPDCSSNDAPVGFNYESILPLEAIV